MVESAGIIISHPFIRRLDRRFKMSLGFENKRSASTLLGFPFSFSRGEVDGKAEASALYLVGEWMQRGERSVLAARVTYNHGVGAFGASKSDTAPDSRFDMFVGQLEYIRNMGWRESRGPARCRSAGPGRARQRRHRVIRVPVPAVRGRNGP